MTKVTKEDVARMAHSVRISSTSDAADILDELAALCLDDDPEIANEAVRQAMHFMLRDQSSKMRW